MVDSKERREKYIELRKRFPRRIMFNYLEPLFDEIFDELPEEFPDGELFYIRSTRQTGFRCKKCNNVRLIDYKHVSRDIWNPILENKETICVHCNRTLNILKGWDKIQYLMSGDTEECLEYQKEHREQWLAAGKTGSNTIKRYFNPNDELYNTENAKKTRELFEKNRVFKESYSKEKILTLIEESHFKDRKDVINLLSKVRYLKNYSDEIENEILKKAKENNIEVVKLRKLFSKSDIINLINNSKINSKEDFSLLIRKIKNLVMFDEEISDLAIKKAEENNIIIEKIGSSFTEKEIKRLIENYNISNYKDFVKITRIIKHFNNYNEILYNEIIQKAREFGIPTNRREEIYSKPLSLISFDSQDREVSLDDIDSYSKIPGVWSVWSENNCLDVYQTKDIGKEILLFLRRIDNLQNPNINTKNKSWDTKYNSMLEKIF